MTQTVDIYNHLFKNYITYDMLYHLNFKAFYGETDADRCNIFIDLNSYTKSLFDDYPQFSYKNPSTPVAASVINLVAHLRYYYLSRHNTYSRFYLVWGENIPDEAIKHKSDYNAHYYQAFNAKTVMRDLIYKNLDILKDICPYLPDIYFINGGRQEVSVCIAALIDNPGMSHIFDPSTKAPNIIFTKDPYAYQLICNCSNTYIFRPKKSKGANGMVIDDSWIVTKKNLIGAYLIETSGRLTQAHKDIDWTQFELMLDLTGLKARHAKGTTTNTNAIRILKHMNDTFGVMKNDIPVNLFMQNLLFHSDEDTKLRGYNFLMIEDVHNTVNLPHQFDVFKASPQYLSIFSDIVDLVAPEDVKEINNKYFIDYPLDLMHL